MKQAPLDHLTVRAWHGQAWAASFTLAPGQTLRLGRSSRVTGRLEDPLVSREHLEIRPTAGGGFEAVDLGSSGGTWLDGRRITHHPLRHGDRLLLGDTWLLVEIAPVEIASSRDAAAAKPAATHPPPPPLPPPPPPLPAAAVVVEAARAARPRGRSRRFTPLLVAALCGVGVGLFGWWVAPWAVATWRRLGAPTLDRPGAGVAAATVPRASPGALAVAAAFSPSTDGAAQTTELAAATVGTADVALASDHGAVTIPASALPAGTEVHLRRVDAAPAGLRSSFPLERWGQHGPLSPLLEVDLAGASLGAPATVSFPLAAADARAVEQLTVLSYEPRTGVWDAVPAHFDSSSGRVTAEVRHFSIIHLAGLVLAPFAWTYFNWEYVSSAQCVDSTANRFAVCMPWGTDASGLVPYATAGKNGPELVQVPPLVAALAQSLDTADSRYRSEGFRVPATKTYVYIKSLEAGKFAEFQAPSVAGSPFLLVNQTATPALAQSNAAHEYFHYVQYLYLQGAGSAWWREASATAVENVLFPDNYDWISTYYSGPQSGTTELDGRLGAIDDGGYGYRVSLFATYLVRTRGGLPILLAILGNEPGRPILQAIAVPLGGNQALERVWLDYGRSFVGPSWGSYLSAQERERISRRLTTRGVALEHPRAHLAESRPETPLSALLYDVRLNRAQLPANRTSSGPLLVRLLSASAKRQLHVMLPQGTAGSTSPVTHSLDGARPAQEVTRLSAQRSAAASSTDLFLWLVDGALEASGQPVEVRVTWLLPPENVGHRPASPGTGGKQAGGELRWDEHPLAARTAKPAAPFADYAVYRRDTPTAAPVRVTTTTDTHHGLQGVDDLCAEYAVRTRLDATQVAGTAESDPSAWVAAELPAPVGFALAGKLGTPDNQGERPLDVSAEETRIGVRGLEIEAVVGGVTRLLYREERRAEAQRPGVLRPERAVRFAPPAAGTAFRLTARAWLLPRDHRCFDPARHLRELVIAEEDGEADPAGAMQRSVIHDTSVFGGPADAIEVGKGTASCLAASPHDRGKRTTVTFSELPPAGVLELGGTLDLSLAIRTEPGSPVFSASYLPLALWTGAYAASLETRDGFLHRLAAGDPLTRGPEPKGGSSAQWLLGGAHASNGKAQLELWLLCQAESPLGAAPGKAPGTQLKVRWEYPIDQLFRAPGPPPGSGPRAGDREDFDFGGRWHAHYQGAANGRRFDGIVLLEAESDPDQLRLYQLGRYLTGNPADTSRHLVLDAALSSDGAVRYTHQLWTGNPRGVEASSPPSSGTSRLELLDRDSFRLTVAIGDQPATVTYRRQP